MSGSPSDKIVSAEALRALAARIFEAAGLTVADAALVAADMVEGDLCGLTSHGVFRVAQYVEALRERGLNPRAEVTPKRESAATGVYDCGWGLGIVSAHRLTDRLLEKVGSTGLAAVVGTECYHIGRLANYAQRIARSGYLGFVAAAGTARCHYVVPWGGRSGRLATNPFAYGVPCGGDSIVLDMSTAMSAEGKVRAAKTLGKRLPPGFIVDGQGRPSTDPEDFYRVPHGHILPFGGDLGYKGFGLGVLVEVLGRCLAGQLVREEDKTYKLENGVFMAALDPTAFCGKEAFSVAVRDLKEYITSSPPADGQGAVMMPGGYDAAIRRERLADGIPLPAEVWAGLLQTAALVGVDAGTIMQGCR